MTETVEPDVTENEAEKASAPKKSKKTAHANKFGSILSFRRSINPGAGFLFSRTGERLTPVEVKEAGYTGSFTNDASDKSKVADVNPGKADFAILPGDADGLVLKFSIILTPDSKTPDSFNVPSDADFFKNFSDKFYNAGGFSVLSEKYLSALVSGRPLFRNRNLMSNKKVSLTVYDENGETSKVSFNIDGAYKKSRLLNLTELAVLAYEGSVETAFDAFYTGLVERPVRIDVEFSGDVPGGLEVYPSQEFADDELRKNLKLPSAKNKGRILSSQDVNLGNGKVVRQATMHPQKIGNAIRTIDDMRSASSTEDYGVLPVEVYGFSRSLGMALRSKTAGDGLRHDGPGLFELMTKSTMTEMIADFENAKVSDDAVFLVACLIRGGVFGNA